MKKLMFLALALLFTTYSTASNATQYVTNTIPTTPTVPIALTTPTARTAPITRTIPRVGNRRPHLPYAPVYGSVRLHSLSP